MKRNHVNLGYSKKMDMIPGYLYPTYVEDLIPGDIARLGQSEVIRAVNPPTAPITDNFKYHTVYVAVPKRILDRHYVRNMTGTKTGDVHGNFKAFNPMQLITWLTKDGVGSLDSSFDLTVNDELGQRTLSVKDFSNGSLMDYFSADLLQNIGINDNKINVNRISAYYLAWNFLFRNAEIEDAVAPIWDIENNESVDAGLQRLDVYEHLQDEEGCDFVLPSNSPLCNKGLMRVHWRKDYFTDVTLNSQRGTMPTVPVNFNSPSAVIPVYNVLGNDNGFVISHDHLGARDLTTSDTRDGFLDPTIESKLVVGNYGSSKYNYVNDAPENVVNAFKDYFGVPQADKSGRYSSFDSALKIGNNIGALTNQRYGGFYGAIDNVDATLHATFSVTDLRAALVISHFMEMNNTGGFKWSEFLMTHYGTCPSDESLERPLLIGTYSDDIYTTEVVQTSESGTTAQGNVTGHMLGVGGRKGVCTFRAKEPMIVLGLSWISVERNYESGITREWLKRDYLDEYLSVFNGLGAQAIDIQELNVVNTSTGAYSFKDKPKNFAFAERNSHLLSRRNEVCGRLRSGTAKVFSETENKFVDIATFYGGTYENYYHNYAIGETYGIYGDNELQTSPTSAVSPEFLAMKPQLTDIFSSSTDVPFVCTIYNRADYFRPVPFHTKVGVSYV